eukprot:CAMPEP_0172152972 /NCGR_PEP_ID=MMETSP1050-20130122/1159_1 /TAXON_ID=233186 /ORGANISM="Cryptomonas curvata, Strain CCAP979/52" /LENGTH=224 /DNA_ID=CAMNT_0012821403 /DNA_START=30 /DNA_END=700 /DNA_ORIENTATION=-
MPDAAAANGTKIKKGVRAMERRNALLMYCVAIVIAIPIWWRLTEIYRVHLPFESLDRSDEEGLQGLREKPILVVQFCFFDEHHESREGVRSWLEEQINNLVRASDNVNVIVRHLDCSSESIPPTSDYSPNNLTSAEILDDYLQLQLQNHASTVPDITVFLISTNRRALSDARVLTMGKYQHGWIFLPTAGSSDTEATIKSLAFLPQALCGVLLGETEAPTSLIP